jgi:hypothetical protein
MAPGRPIGERPSAIELAEPALELISKLAERIELIESRLRANEDGAPPVPGPNLRPLKSAAPLIGFSPSGLRKRMHKAERNREAPWWIWRISMLLVDLDRCPVRRKV